MQNPKTHETYVRDHAGVRRTIEAADPEAGPWPIHGVAIAAGDVVRDKQGNRILITADALASARFSKAAAKLTKDHPDYEGESPPVDATVGNNAMAYSPDGEAMVYDATTHVDEIAAGVHGNSYEVSVHLLFQKGDWDAEAKAYAGKNLIFRDLSVVSVGDSKSNTAQFGERADIAAWANSGGIEAALSASDDPADAPPPEDESTASLWHRLGRRVGAIGADAEAHAQHSDESAESDSGPETKQMKTDRDDDIEFITAHSHFSDEVLAAMDDDELEQTRDLVDSDSENDPDSDPDDGAGKSTDDPADDDPADDAPNTVEIDIGDHDSFDAYLDDKLAEHEVSASKSDQVEEIIAASAGYGDDDREELMASPPGVVRKIHTTATKPGAAYAPLAGGVSGEVEASLGEDTDDLDAFGTGVAE